MAVNRCLDLTSSTTIPSSFFRSRNFICKCICNYKKSLLVLLHNVAEAAINLAVFLFSNYPYSAKRSKIVNTIKSLTISNVND